MSNWVNETRRHKAFRGHLHAVKGSRGDAVRGHLAELREDTDLWWVIAEGLPSSPRSTTTDRVIRYGRRIGWYAFPRALRPEFVVETGTSRRPGSAVIVAALLKNGLGRLWYRGVGIGALFPALVRV